jgi:hypothetical protein
MNEIMHHNVEYELAGVVTLWVAASSEVLDVFKQWIEISPELVTNLNCSQVTDVF